MRNVQNPFGDLERNHCLSEPKYNLTHTMSSGTASSLSAAQVNILIERLVKTVARAFYPDNTIIVLDALVREKYIKESELGPRLRMKEKDIRAVLNRLENKDLLVKHESLLTRDLDTKNRQHKFYYIDYQMFVDVVRYRIFLMQRKVDSIKGDDAQDSVSFECPSCNLSINMLEATRARSRDNKFVCTRCCPFDDFREKDADASFVLISKAMARSALKSAATLKQKLNDCMSMSVHHDSIFAMLKELSRSRISRNVPSENMRLGFSNTTVTDEDTQVAITQNMGKAVAQKKGRYLIQNAIAKVHSKEATMEVEIELGDGASDSRKRPGGSGLAAEDDSDDDGSGASGQRKKVKRATHMPDFLRRSGVQGADDVYKLDALNAVASYKLGTDTKGGNGAGVGGAEGEPTKLLVGSLSGVTNKPDTAAEMPAGEEAAAAAAAAAAAVEEEGDGDEGSDDDDIAWEDDE